MSKSPQKHIGLIGCGNWGKNILEQLIKLGSETSVVARSQESINNAARIGASRIVSTIQELKNIEGLVVATPTESHFDVLEKSLPLGVPIFVEKPITASLEETALLRVKASGQIFVMDKYRYHPAVRTLTKLAAKGELGNIRGVKTRRQGWGISAGPTDCIWDLAPHELSIVMTLLGHIPEIKFKTVELLDAKPIGFSIYLGDSPMASCEVVKGCKSKMREVTVFFSAGLAMWNDREEDSIRVLRLEDLQQKDSNAGTVIRVSKEDPLGLELAAFISFLDGGPEPMSNLDDAYLFAQRISEIASTA